MKNLMFTRHLQVVPASVGEVAAVRDLEVVVRAIAIHLVTMMTEDLVGTTTNIHTDVVTGMIETTDVQSEAHPKKHTPVGASHAMNHEAHLHAVTETVGAPGHVLAETVITLADVVTDPVPVVQKISIAMSQVREEKALIPETVIPLEIVAIEVVGTGATVAFDLESLTIGPPASLNPIVIYLV